MSEQETGNSNGIIYKDNNTDSNLTMKAGDFSK